MAQAISVADTQQDGGCNVCPVEESERLFTGVGALPDAKHEGSRQMGEPCDPQSVLLPDKLLLDHSYHLPHHRVGIRPCLYLSIPHSLKT